MDILLFFFRKYKSYIVFVLLEIIALVIISKQSVFQRSLFIQKTSDAVGYIYSQIDEVYAYFSLKASNDALSEHNSYLQNEVQRLKHVVDEMQMGGCADSSELGSYGDKIRFIPARIVNKSVDNVNNFIVLNKGKKDGVAEGMAVVAHGNVLGVVQFVTENYSAVLAIFSQKIKLSGKIKNNQYLCTVIWDGSSIDSGEVFSIPRHVNVSVGDSIVTSGYSSIFPPDYLIGVVKNITVNQSALSKDLDVKYSVDFMTVDYADIVVYKDIDELDFINSKSK